MHGTLADDVTERLVWRWADGEECGNCNWMRPTTLPIEERISPVLCGSKAASRMSSCAHKCELPSRCRHSPETARGRVERARREVEEVRILPRTQAAFTDTSKGKGHELAANRRARRREPARPTHDGTGERDAQGRAFPQRRGSARGVGARWPDVRRAAPRRSPPRRRGDGRRGGPSGHPLPSLHDARSRHATFTTTTRKRRSPTGSPPPCRGTNQTQHETRPRRDTTCVFDFGLRPEHGGTEWYGPAATPSASRLVERLA